MNHSFRCCRYPLAVMLSVLLWPIGTQRGMAQMLPTAATLPPSVQVGSIAGQEFCTLLTDETLAETAAANDEDIPVDASAAYRIGAFLGGEVSTRVFERISVLYGETAVLSLALRLTSMFESNEPLDDPYLVDVVHNMLRFAINETSCYQAMWDLLFQLNPSDSLPPVPLLEPSSPTETKHWRDIGNEH